MKLPKMFIKMQKFKINQTKFPFKCSEVCSLFIQVDCLEYINRLCGKCR